MIEQDEARVLLEQLSGFRGYPKGKGLDRFVEVLAEISISVEHATALIETFDREFPMLCEIRDTAFNLRPRFQVMEDQRTKWEAQYGKPDPIWPETVAKAIKRPSGRLNINTLTGDPHKEFISLQRRAEIQAEIEQIEETLRQNRARSELGEVAE